MVNDDVRDVPTDPQRLRHTLRSQLSTIILNVDLLRLTVRGESNAVDAIARAAAEISAAVGSGGPTV